MAEIVSSLFGPSPQDEYRRIQDQQNAIASQAFSSAAGSPGQLKAQAYANMGGAAVRGGMGMMGIEPTAVVQAKQQQAIMQGADTQTPEGLMEIAKRFNDAGMPQQAHIAAQAAQQMVRERAEAERAQAGVDLASRKQDFAEQEAMEFKLKQLEQIKARDEAASEDRRLSIQQRDDASKRAEATDLKIAQLMKEVHAAGSNGGRRESMQPLAYIDPVTGQPKYGTIAEARGNKPASLDAITMAGVASGRASGAGAGKDIALIPKMQEGLDSINGALATIDKGIYTGAYANIVKGAVKWTPGMDTTKAANTEEYLAAIGNVVVPRLQEFGGSDSNEELKYLQKISAGDVTVEKGALVKILNSAKVKMEKEIARRNAGYAATYVRGYAPKRENSVSTGRTVTREVKLKDGRIGVEYSDGTRGFK